MARNQISFFATKDDLLSLLRAVESERRLQVVVGGMFDEMPDVKAQDSLLGSLDLESTTSTISSANYLLFAPGTSVEIRRVEQRRGGVRYAVDQLANPKTVGLRPGGQFEGCIIAGQLGTASDDPSSLELFRFISKQARRLFTKVKAFYVGKEASELLDKGWRLTTDVKSPPLYDLKRD
jgi:hypothetical protein